VRPDDGPAQAWEGHSELRTRRRIGVYEEALVETRSRKGADEAMFTIALWQMRNGIVSELPTFRERGGLGNYRPNYGCSANSTPH
jgi:hypothetical protein